MIKIIPKVLLLILLLLLLLSGCSSSQFMGNSDKKIDVNHIQANMQVLASDEFEGRESTTRGEKLASLFISSELKKYGVKPLFGDTSYLQPFDLLVKKIDTASTLTFSIGTDEIVLNYADDFVYRGKRDESIEINTQFVFAGFGITAPEYFYDNYAGLDVSNKYVLILDGEPESDDSLFFEGSPESKYAKSDYKVSTAKENGALGCIIIADDNTQKYWSWIKQYSPRPRFSLPDSESPRRERSFYYLLSQESLGKLMQSNENVYPTIINKLSSNSDCTSIELSGSLKITIKQNEEVKTAYNVVGIIPGIDPKLSNEYIAIGAHYDHEGVVDGIVYNGADDDASGTAAVLEVARAISSERNNLRSILVIFHAAEEKGLLGSQYFTDNFGSINNIIAQVNLDMVGREHIDTLYSVGSDKLSSELKTIVEDVNRNTVNFTFNYKFDDPNDRERIFYRSDHYNYAKHGIPIVFFTDNMQQDYHRPTDDFEKIDFMKLQKVSKLVYKLVERVANLDNRLVTDK